jgi:hypothetical protein
VNRSKNDVSTENFCKEFDNQYAWPILESHLNVVFARKSRFVGTKAICASLKLLCSAIKVQRTRNLMQDKIPYILNEICIPMMLLSEQEF